MCWKNDKGHDTAPAAGKPSPGIYHRVSSPTHPGRCNIHLGRARVGVFEPLKNLVVVFGKWARLRWPKKPIFSCAAAGHFTFWGVGVARNGIDQGFF